MDLELLDADAAQLALLFLTNGWVLGDLPDLLIRNLLLLFPETSHSLLERTGLNDSRGGSSELVLAGLALFQFLNPDQDVLGQAVGQVGILLCALPNPRPVLDLARHRAGVLHA
ncbi:MAG: hypothetical protein AUJ92_12865 [Armatimonadetes bacterium CG2_30_59_28]|nr:MAG: hypothetical protein AUJ92_12865 [Armatimonadetes bacterium CG2_30_59_28]